MDGNRAHEGGLLSSCFDCGCSLKVWTFFPSDAVTHHLIQTTLFWSYWHLQTAEVFYWLQLNSSKLLLLRRYPFTDEDSFSVHRTMWADRQQQASTTFYQIFFLEPWLQHTPSKRLSLERMIAPISLTTALIIQAKNATQLTLHHCQTTAAKILTDRLVHLMLPVGDIVSAQ